MKTGTQVRVFVYAALLGTFCCTPLSAAFVINLNYSGDIAYTPSFVAAKTTWESRLSGYQDGLVIDRTAGSSYSTGQTVLSVSIHAQVATIDGAANTLGQASVTERVLDQSNYQLATDGTLTIDSADVVNLNATGMLENVILHEMGHVLGFGSLWGPGINNLYLNGSGEFTGVNATVAWQNEFGQLGTPDVELEGGGGTANVHWNENLNGTGLTGITDSLGRDMRDELMTGWLNPNSFISELTLASFRDIGFTTPNATAVPEPGTGGVLVAGLVVGMGWRRRRSL